jgi:hypothetical protein
MINKEKNEHIVPKKDGWGVKVAGSDRTTKIFPTRVEAIDYGKELAKKHNVCMVVHDETGKFEEFDCKPEFKNKHVVKKDLGWAVIAEGGNEVERIFETKGAAMAYAYELADMHDVCMLVHNKDGKFESKTCPKDELPGVLEIFKLKLKLNLAKI